MRRRFLLRPSRRCENLLPRLGLPLLYSGSSCFPPSLLHLLLLLAHSYLLSCRRRVGQNHYTPMRRRFLLRPSRRCDNILPRLGLQCLNSGSSCFLLSLLRLLLLLAHTYVFPCRRRVGHDNYTPMRRRFLLRPSRRCNTLLPRLA